MAERMKVIVITPAAKALLDANANGARMLGGMPQRDGNWRIEVDAEVHARLLALDADMSVEITRLCSGQWGSA